MNRNLAKPPPPPPKTKTTKVIFNRTRVARENSDGWWIR